MKIDIRFEIENLFIIKKIYKILCTPHLHQLQSSACWICNYYEHSFAKSFLFNSSSVIILNQFYSSFDIYLVVERALEISLECQ